MYVGPAPGGVTRLDAASAWLGNEIEVGVAFSTYGSWAEIEGSDWSYPSWSTWKKAKPGRQLHYRMSMMPTGVTLASVASGAHDSHFVTAANRLAQYGMLDISIALGWEMDLKWAPWTVYPGNGQQANFQAAWRRIVTVMRNAQPTNKWKWVWNPTEDAAKHGVAYMDSIWPGNAYVDWIGIDAYDFSWFNIDGVSVYYPSTCDSACRLSRQQKVWSFRIALLNKFRDYGIAKDGKPLAFPEWGCSTWKLEKNLGHGGGDNPYYIQKMHEFFTNPSNNVVMQAYFNRENSILDHKIGNGSSALPTSFPQASAKFNQLFGAGSQ